MTSIAGLRGTTGKDWYSWPVGTPAPALSEISALYGEESEAANTISSAITSCDELAIEVGAALAGIWIPQENTDLIPAQWWVRILTSPEEDTLRSARRYERTVKDRTVDGTTIVFSQYLSTFFASDVEAVLIIETRADGDEAQPYILAQTAYFPLWTKDRVVLEALCSHFTLTQEFADEVATLASSLILESSDSNNEE